MSTPVVSIQTAERAGSRLVIGISGISGSGKTLTALLLAYGMTGGDGSKIGLLCTENRRGRLYADRSTYELAAAQLCIPVQRVTPFLVGDMEPPFSPVRYSDAILQFQQAGVEILVIDSVSHEWEGIGGCEEIAERGAQRGMKDWKTAKGSEKGHRKFMNTLLACDMHIIACIRAREKVKIERVNGKTEVTPLGILPVCEKNFMFEMTVSMMMWAAGQSREVVKASGTDGIFGAAGHHTGYLTADHGRQLRAWVDGAVQLDPEIERGRNTLRTIAARGMTAYRAAWSETPERVRRALIADGTHETLKASASAFDSDARAAQAGGADLADLNDAVAAG
ncbi:AAA family ATPase [Stenotrophomonas maltophilia]|uniref:AAA family ATPase n=1 Tax=Stenotrophomonas maltophilia TaxID=40324 RepID=UPI002B1DC9E7|nr:AAA family ATPase [Stenotrophomonas maltophilia]